MSAGFAHSILDGDRRRQTKEVRPRKSDETLSFDPCEGDTRSKVFFNLSRFANAIVYWFSAGNMMVGCLWGLLIWRAATRMKAKALFSVKESTRLQTCFERYVP